MELSHFPSSCRFRATKANRGLEHTPDLMSCLSHELLIFALAPLLFFLLVPKIIDPEGSLCSLFYQITFCFTAH